MKRAFIALLAVSMFAQHVVAQQKLGPISTPNLNGIRLVDRFVGATPNAQWTAAIADCPVSGCYVKGTGMGGTQTFTAAVVFPSSKTVALELGQGTISGPCPLFDLSNAADGSALLGAGAGDPSFIDSPSSGTKLVCTSGTVAVKIGTGSPRLNGIRAESFAINCNSLAAAGVQIDTIQYSIFRNIDTSNCTSYGWHLQVSNTGFNVNNFANRFEKLSGAGNPVGIQFDGNAVGGGNNTQNFFGSLTFNFTGVAALLCNACDNNFFSAIRGFRTSGTGTAVVMASNSGAITGGVNNHFQGLIGGNSGVSAYLGQNGTYGNTIWGYDYINGEAGPILQATSQVTVDGSVLCSAGGCPGASGTNPTRWIYAQGNAGNTPTSNPVPLVTGCGLAWNFSNGGGEGDIVCNLGGGNGSHGILELWAWNGTTATQRALFSNSDIGTVLGSNPDGPVHKHKRTTGCTTGAVAGNSCLTTITWTTPYADANYSVNCTLENTTQLGHLGNTGAIAAGSFQINTVTDAAFAISGIVDCSATHD